MEYNSSHYDQATALRYNMLRTLAAEAALSYYKILFNLNMDNAQDPIFEADKLEQLLKSTGYSYDPEQNIFYSRTDAWQRNYGYCRLYDEAAAPLSMIIDCEPIRFEYGNKKWLIELWKGQYGMTTGGEIGVFTKISPDLIHGAFYQSVPDEDCLPISFVLKKDSRVLFRRSATHWWLTGFILGEFSEPSELIMEVTITLKNEEMRKAFVDSLLQLGYSDQEIGVAASTVQFTFSDPRSEQPRSRTELISRLSQKKNEFLCRQYQSLAKASHNMYDILKRIEQKSPELFRQVMDMGKPGKLFWAYEAVSKYLGTTDT